jgi:hypothetical protein
MLGNFAYHKPFPVGDLYGVVQIGYRAIREFDVENRAYYLDDPPHVHAFGSSSILQLRITPDSMPLAQA